MHILCAASHCFPLSGDREVTTVEYAKARRREKMKRTLTDFFCKPPKLIGVWLNRESAPLWRGLGWCMPGIGNFGPGGAV